MMRLPGFARRRGRRNVSNGRRGRARGGAWPVECLEGRALLTAYSVHFDSGTGDLQILVGSAAGDPAGTDGPSDVTLATVNTTVGGKTGTYYQVSVTIGSTQTYQGLFYAPDVNTIEIEPGDGGGTVHVGGTTANTATTVQDAGKETVTVGGVAGGVQGILGTVDVTGTAGATALRIDDSGDTAARTATVTNASVTGLSPAEIDYGSPVTSLTVLTGQGGGNTTDVVSTGITTSIVGSSPSSGPDDTVYVANNDSADDPDGFFLGLQSIDAPLNISNTVGDTAITLDDSADLVPGNFAPTLTNDSVIGLAPAAVGYAPAHTQSLTIDGTSDVNRQDTYTVSSLPSAPVTLNGGPGGAIIHLQTTAGSLDIRGAAEIVGPNAGTTFYITGNDAGIIGSGVAFSGVGNLFGGSGNDTFKFANGKGVSGYIRGGGGTNTLNYASYTTPVSVNLGTGAATGIAGGFMNIQNIVGGGGSDTLIGPNATAQWLITNTNTGGVAGDTFSSFENLTGGSGNDTFKFVEAKTVSGKIDGGGGTNTLNYASYTTPVNINLATDTAPGIFGGFAHIQSVVGGSAANTLIGPNAAESWSITGTNAGGVAGVTFSSFGNLTGGSGNDTFKFADGKTISGKVNGGGGTNTLNYASYTTTVNVNLATHAAPAALGGYSNIQGFVGGSGTSTIFGPNATETWSITNTNAGSVAGITFSGFGYLVGGSGLDVFQFSNGKGVTGRINGGGGSNWLDESLYTSAVNVNLTAGTATGAGAGVVNIQNVRGGSGGGTLTGSAQNNILVGGAGADTITGGSGRSIIIGDKGADALKAGSRDAILIGGSTTFDASSVANDLALQSILAEWVSGNSYAVRISHIKNGGGLNGSNKFVLGSTVLDDLAANKLTGGAGSDWFFQGAHDTLIGRSAGEQVN